MMGFQSGHSPCQRSSQIRETDCGRLLGAFRLKQTLPAIRNALVDDFFRLISAALATLEQVDGLGNRLLRLDRFLQVTTIIDP
jgi:hypothetical protein